MPEILTGLLSASIGSVITMVVSNRKNTADAVKTEFETYKKLIDDKIKRLEDLVCCKMICDNREKLDA